MMVESTDFEIRKTGLGNQLCHFSGWVAKKSDLCCVRVAEKELVANL